MVDVHIHILPGLDDGSDSMAESVLMAETAVQSGVDTIVATPHSHQIGRYENYYTASLQEAFQAFQEEVRRQNLPLEVYLGMEIYAHRDIREQIQKGRLIGLNHSEYYLIEFGFREQAEYMEGILREVLAAGKTPVIAHPERYLCIQRQPELVRRFLSLGCLSQIDKNSVFGGFGQGARKTAVYLLNHRLVTLVASDAHSSVSRTPDMEKIRDFLELYYGMEEAARLLETRARSLLQNQKIDF